MADLDPLIRYRKHSVDEKQRILAALYREAEELQQQKIAIEQEVEREKELSEKLGTADAAAFLGLYLQGAKSRISVLEQKIRKIETKIVVAQEDMRNAFAEMKKVEITQRGRQEREDKARKHKEDQELDEMAIEGFRRRREQEDESS